LLADSSGGHTIKVNFDAAINKNTGFIGLGLIARDHKGYLLGAKCLTKSFLIDAHTVELMAASYAVNFCSEVGLFNVIFEGDALNVIREVNSNPPFLSFPEVAILLKVLSKMCIISDPLLLSISLES
jgi:hypothetical protein